MRKNMLVCLKCEDVIESTHRRDFKWCKCGAVFIDGGQDYRRCGGDLENVGDALTFLTEKYGLEIAKKMTTLEEDEE